jgi:hypothetical protein
LIKKNWMSEYIDFNTQKRKEANNEFEKNLHKLKNVSVYGKTCERGFSFNIGPI